MNIGTNADTLDACRDYLLQLDKTVRKQEDINAILNIIMFLYNHFQDDRHAFANQAYRLKSLSIATGLLETGFANECVSALLPLLEPGPLCFTPMADNTLLELEVAKQILRIVSPLHSEVRLAYRATWAGSQSWGLPSAEELPEEPMPLQDNAPQWYRELRRWDNKRAENLAG